MFGYSRGQLIINVLLNFDSLFPFTTFQVIIY